MKPNSWPPTSVFMGQSIISWSPSHCWHSTPGITKSLWIARPFAARVIWREIFAGLTISHLYPSTVTCNCETHTNLLPRLDWCFSALLQLRNPSLGARSAVFSCSFGLQSAKTLIDSREPETLSATFPPDGLGNEWLFSKAGLGPLSICRSHYECCFAQIAVTIT